MQWVEVITLSLSFMCVGILIGYSFGRVAQARAVKADPFLAYTRAELKGFTCGMLAALVAIHSKTDPPSRSPPVSVTGQRLISGQPTESPPVAGACGETG